MNARPAITELLPAVAAGLPGACLCVVLLPSAGLAGLGVAAIAALASWSVLTPSLRTLTPQTQPWLQVWLSALTLATLGWIGETPWLGPALALVVTVLPRPVPRWGLVTLLGSMLGLVGLAAQPWTLLELQWQAWSDWVPEAVLAGTLLAGTGAQLYDSDATPGLFRWSGLAVGMSLSLALAAVVASAWGYQYSLGAAVLMGAIAVLAPALVWLDRPQSRAWKLALIAITAWLAWGPEGALFASWGVLTPVALTAGRYLQVRGDRWPAVAVGWAGASVVWLGIAAANVTTLDLDLVGAVCVALSAVALFWMWAVPRDWPQEARP